MNKIINKVKNYSLIVVLVQLLIVILSTITIFFPNVRIILEATIILVPTLVVFAWLLLFSAKYINIYKFEANNPYSYINLDVLLYFVIMIIGFSLIIFDFSILYILIANILFFIYFGCIYNIKNYIWNSFKDGYEQQEN